MNKTELETMIKNGSIQYNGHISILRKIVKKQLKREITKKRKNEFQKEILVQYRKDHCGLMITRYFI